MHCRSGWLTEAILITGGVFAMISGLMAFRLRRRGLLKATMLLCLLLPFLFLFTWLMSETLDGMAALVVYVTGVFLFAPASIAAWIGAGLGWWMARSTTED